MRAFLIAIIALPSIAAAQPAAPKKQTPNDIVGAAPASAWRTIAPDDLLVMTLDGGGQVVI